MVFTSCQSKEYFFFPTFSGSFDFDLHQQVSVVYLENKISFSAVNDSLLNSLEDGLLESVDVEGFCFDCTISERNEVDSAYLDVYIADQEGNNLVMFEDVFLDTDVLEPGVNYPLYDYLNSDGVLELKSVLSSLQEDPEREILFVLGGRVFPPDSYAAMEIGVHFKVNMKVSASGFR
ncbi:MAG: hypothetical protein CSA95_09030 [Bacteroidetes bacterium]|nr:MAG: hypothetical protein CSA95_09030 [Bacteroidota bacterium]